MTGKPPLTGVVLLNMGGPDTLSAVRPFLARLFLDRDLVPLPMAPLTQPVFAWLVSGLRARKVRRYYGEIGGGSPLGALTEAQGRALEASLREAGENARVYVAMRYWHPLARHAALAMRDDGVDRIVALPLYPQYFGGTTGSSLKDLAKALRWVGVRAPVAEVRSFPDHPGYVAALTEKVAGTLARAGLGDPAAGVRDAALLFSAHGVPAAAVEAGDPYRDEILRTVAAVTAAFPGIPHGVSYQSRAGRTRWLAPDTVGEVRRLGREGVRTLVVVPVSFVSDHIETLHELDIRLAAVAREAGIAAFHRVPALNDDPAFIRALRDIALSAVNTFGTGRG